MKKTNTFLSILSLIHCLKNSPNLQFTTSVHSMLLKLGSLNDNRTTTNHLINSYLKHQQISHAHKLFDEITEPDVATFTSLMAGYIDTNQPDISLYFFKQMAQVGIHPNDYTFATAINACAHLADTKTGVKLHALVETVGMQNDLVVSTALVGFYAKSNDIIEARKVFDRMVHRNVVSWGAMMSGYAQNADGHDAVLLFSDFLARNLQPNHFMLSSVVNACASIGRLGVGKSTHAKVVRYKHEGNEIISGGLIDMYAKCGCIEYSKKVFDKIASPCLVSYTSMIAAAAKYGLPKLALDLFDEMLAEGVKPNEITFLGVLHACSHGGLVETGLGYLDSMGRIHGVVPKPEHYTCAVDMLGRAGRLDEAYELTKSVGAEGDDELMMWSALLSASSIHKELGVAAEAGEKLREFGRDVAGAYVAASNAYASAGEVDGVMHVRSEMRRRGIRKEPGCSWVEIKGVAYVFYAGGVERCVRGREIAAFLKGLEVRVGRCLIGERVHSEILALGFGLLSLGRGVAVRIMKNLRMCRTCHEKFKVISEAVGREFVVRDLNRFHQFKGGVCSCGDYW